MSETIINGIDVSECDYFEKQHIEDMYESDDCNVCIDNFCALCWKECEKHNGCYFKQLKRLQLELDIKEKMFDKFMIGSGETLGKLQQENKKLKKHCEEWALETVKMQGTIDGKDFKIDKYKQALEEIRSYCDEQNLKADYTACFITNRIDEVLNDRD